MHDGQVRQSGEPYISHPPNVFYILAEMHADRDTLCAGLLHDILENPPKEEITHEFNENGVTKMCKMNFFPNLIKILLTRKTVAGITEDIKTFYNNEELIGKEMNTCGWVRTIRRSKNMCFVEINDGTTLDIDKASKEEYRSNIYENDFLVRRLD